MRRRAALLAALLSSGPALAHEPPVANGVSFDGAGRVYVRTNRGLIVSDTARSSFRLLCNEAYGINTTEVPRWVVQSGGDVLLSTSAGLLRGASGLCAWNAVAPELDGVLMAGLAVDPADPDALFAIRTTSGEHTDLFASTDGGATWAAVGDPILDTFYQDLLVAPSTPSRLYASGLRFVGGTTEHFVAESRDRGATWVEHPVALEPTESVLVALAVRPTDADGLYAAARATRPTDPDRLLVSSDGAVSFQVGLTELGLAAVAFAPDGASVWAGTAAGVSRSDDGGSTFGEPGGGVTDVSCLVARESELWACARFGLELGVGVSVDGGASFSQLLAFGDVTEPVACDGARVGAACAAQWQDWVDEVLAAPAPPAGDGGSTSPAPDRDGGVGLPPSAFGGGANPDAMPGAAGGGAGCDCSVPGERRRPSESPSGGATRWIGLALLGWAARRRVRVGPRRRDGALAASPTP